ncbi:hypothetical protein A8W25_02450 [Streptomyces sp. ERV7]|uniref:hypothetical protein n=1 Tax=Streptomyces sp. ERV7 TaxID=1322334 RepID=UPI0007F48864|nr:hypothetical protein [Streptomyces sp. ERV7]OAR27150.1 hypothetical protein A8W25_02450 [Streptomyces sp. ERV7]
MTAPAAALSPRQLLAERADAHDWAGVEALSGVQVLPPPPSAAGSRAPAWRHALVSWGYRITGVSELKNSTCGFALRDGRPHFFKYVRARSAVAELAGYLEFGAGGNEVPTLLSLLRTDAGTVMMYEYLPSMGLGRGTLFDLLCRAERAGTLLPEHEVGLLLDRIRANCARRTVCSSSPIDAFFAHRVGERLVPWYFERRLPWLDQRVVVGSVPQPVTMRECMEGTAAFFHDLGARECMLSQGDFSETNVGRGAVFVDLSNAGHNDVRGELATAFWSLFLGGGYLFPKYHPAAYRWREAPYADGAPLCRARLDPRTATLRIDLAHRLSPARADLLRRLLDVFADAFGPELFDHRLAPYLVMRAVGVLDLDTLDPADRAVCTALALHFWNGRDDLGNVLRTLVDHGRTR